MRAGICEQFRMINDKYRAFLEGCAEIGNSSQPKSTICVQGDSSAVMRWQ